MKLKWDGDWVETHATRELLATCTRLDLIVHISISINYPYRFQDLSRLAEGEPSARSALEVGGQLLH